METSLEILTCRSTPVSIGQKTMAVQDLNSYEITIVAA